MVDGDFPRLRCCRVGAVVPNGGGERAIDGIK